MVICINEERITEPPSANSEPRESVNEFFTVYFLEQLRRAQKPID